MPRVNGKQSQMESSRPENMRLPVPDETDAVPKNSPAEATPRNGDAINQQASASDTLVSGGIPEPDRQDLQQEINPASLAVSVEALSLETHDSETRYCMGHSSRGIAVVFNNKKFNSDLNLQERLGTNLDASVLDDMFVKLGFTRDNVHRYNNATAEKMIERMCHYASEVDYTKMDCFIGVILTHGCDAGGIFGTDKKTTLERLLEPFTESIHPSLIGKPKIFIIQACLGDRYDDGHLVPDRVEHDGPTVQRIPREADCLYVFSTVSGYFSWRHPERGSWFIQTLTRIVRELHEEKDMDILRLLTRVNRDVAHIISPRHRVTSIPL